MLAILAGASAAQALTLNDIAHLSDSGGVWNNNNATNWAIWVSPNSDPSSDPPRPFLNEPNPLNNPIAFPTNGTFTYTLYKNAYGNNDVSTTFTFAHGAASGTLTIPGGDSPYIQSNTPVPATPGQTLTLEDVTISIDAFGWYDEVVFNKDFVSPNQNPTPSGAPDQIAVMTFTVVPEPGAALLLALTGAGALLRRRRA